MWAAVSQRGSPTDPTLSFVGKTAFRKTRYPLWRLESVRATLHYSFAWSTLEMHTQAALIIWLRFFELVAKQYEKGRVTCNHNALCFNRRRRGVLYVSQPEFLLKFVNICVDQVCVRSQRREAAEVLVSSRWKQSIALAWLCIVFQYECLLLCGTMSHCFRGMISVPILKIFCASKQA